MQDSGWASCPYFCSKIPIEDVREFLNNRLQLTHKTIKAFTYGDGCSLTFTDGKKNYFCTIFEKLRGTEKTAFPDIRRINFNTSSLDSSFILTINYTELDVSRNTYLIFN